MRILIFGLLLSVTSGSACFAKMQSSIVVGTVYSVFDEEFPSDSAYFRQVESDVELMKKSDINTVMIFPMGEWNPETRSLDWTRTDYLVRKISEAGMNFVPILLKEEQCFSYFPIWEFRDIPGMWDEYNLDNGGRDNRDNVDFDDPRVYPLVENYFKAVAERYGKNPALSFYNVWNEPHYSSDAPHVIASYKEWLKEKYGSLDSLRRAWGIEYSSWDEVSPFLTEDWKSSMPSIDWTLFREHLDGALLDKLTHTLRQFDTVHPVNANPVGTPWANFSSIGGYDADNWEIAAHEDIVGISYYPDAWERAHNLQPCPYWYHNLTFNTVRSAAGDKPYILTELYTNTQNGLALNGYLTKSSVWLLAWTALANDCKGMIYWKWRPFMRGRQSLGRGLCRVDGALAPRGEAVNALGAVVKKYGSILYRARLKRPKVAILLDFVGLLKTLDQTIEPATNKFMYESNAGLFQALYRHNVTVDEIRMDRGLTLAELAPYKILFLPFQIVMRPEVASILKEFVRDGGWLVADARTATIDELDFAYTTNPGAGLDSVFGATSPDWIGGKRYFEVSVHGLRGEAPLSFEGKYFKEEMVPAENSRVIGTYGRSGSPAIIEHRYGKGTAILCGVPLGASCFNDSDNHACRLILDLVKEAGVTPDARFVSPAKGFVNVRVHLLDDSLVVYLINAGKAAESGRLEVGIGRRRITSVEDILTGKKYSFEQRADRITLSIALPAREAAVLLLH